MSVINPNETQRTWKASGQEPTVALFLDEVTGDAASLVGSSVAGFVPQVHVAGASDWIDANALAGAAAAVVQVVADNPSSIKRFQQLASDSQIPLIAAAYDPPLAFVRMLLRAGAHDVVPLPLSIDDLEASLAPVRDELLARSASARTINGKLVSILKSVGGVGATSLLTQAAQRLAMREATQGREVCLIDLDIQFGDVAFQLGLRPRLSLTELIEAGGRLDSALLRATTIDHPSGLKVIAAPPEMMPLEGLSSDHLLQIVDLATREFGTVLVDLPSNWTNWSLSMVARSDLVLLVTELTVAGLNRARRQIELLNSQDLGGLDVRVLVNRYEKNLAKLIRPQDIRDALGRDVAFNVANDFALMRMAIDRGVSIDELKRKSALGKDIDALSEGVAIALDSRR